MVVALIVVYVVRSNRRGVAFEKLFLDDQDVYIPMSEQRSHDAY